MRFATSCGRVILPAVVGIVPGFSVERFEDPLRELHDRIEQDGPFVAHSSRFLLEAVKPRQQQNM